MNETIATEKCPRKNVHKKGPQIENSDKVSGHISLPFIDRFSKIGTFLFRSFFSCYTSLSRFPVNEMKNLLIGSWGDPKSILLRKGSPALELPSFHKLEKVWIIKKEKMTDLIKSYEQQFGNLTAEVGRN